MYTDFLILKKQLSKSLTILVNGRKEPSEGGNTTAQVGSL